MCNFDKLPNEQKEFLHLFLVKAATSIGGMNFLLSLIEAIKSKQLSHALIDKNCQVASNNTIITWNKVIFKDKIELIEQIMALHKSNEATDFNILAEENKKRRKNILNLVRTLSPVEFTVKPQNPKDGEGFSFSVFDATNEDTDTVKLNPVFLALFFCSTHYTKQALKYEN